MKIEANHIGPIEHANVRLGDLTVFVGPQATGKSILLQFLKLVLDSGAIVAEMKRQGLDWDNKLGPFLDVYLGEGMSSVWTRGRSKISLNGQVVDLDGMVERASEETTESVFCIPAQRVLTLGRGGWPRPFSDFEPGDAFVVREFSEKIRHHVDKMGHRLSLFPKTQKLRPEIRDRFQETIFRSFGLVVDSSRGQKRLVLSASRTSKPLPFMAWSAGQREFVPLLLGLFCLSDLCHIPEKKNRWAIVEELELGLHPRAISAVLLAVLELLGWNYRVCLSTHSPHVLDLIWALKVFQQNHASAQKLLELFELRAESNLKALATEVLSKDARVYYFDPKSGETKDISDLDPGSEDAAMAGWGGLTEFSGHVGDVVADVVNNSSK